MSLSNTQETRRDQSALVSSRETQKSSPAVETLTQKASKSVGTFSISNKADSHTLLSRSSG